MLTRPVTYDQLADLLTELGFQRKVVDEHRIAFIEKAGDGLFVLPNRPPDTIAREKDVGHVRFQLHWRGLMEEAEFDRHFSHPVPTPT